jgi:hypothetical protein
MAATAKQAQPEYEAEYADEEYEDDDYANPGQPARSTNSRGRS